ncbi:MULTISPECIES: 4'-phosphopantetheinyl transferase superfamily protein [unclassified Achromobacter]|uniref:4'-phosphopantetheinyl transferase family protein n=1 Tax=unclassified Achromobacter TaxID=2626865 RepID=UPI000B516CE2|nr:MULTISPECIES: 4'-phosphopantetheinyl transferase superfamily protein [unclassified Achromobacter]OWT81103.1 4'-phosphopantetheinyl transferase [Achromobacter sp. HZ34]OWT82604.1 4'-phosphopantetheinyl transferase [Achromobacter sp. HZ28]
MGERAVLLPAEGRWPDGVDVWRVAIAETAVDFPYLDDDERARARRFLRASDRIRFATTRSVLRELLARYAGARPEDLRFCAGPHGRPELAPLAISGLSWPGQSGAAQSEAGLSSGPLSFNVSHAHDEAMIAISRTHTVGVDIEYIKPGFDWPPLIPLVCTEQETRALHACAQAAGEDAARARFFRCWTAKEAVLKTLGLGITEGLQALDIDLEKDGPQFPLVRENPRFAAAAAVRLHWVKGMPGYMACVASLAGAPAGKA